MARALAVDLLLHGGNGAPILEWVGQVRQTSGGWGRHGDWGWTGNLRVGPSKRPRSLETV